MGLAQRITVLPLLTVVMALVAPSVAKAAIANQVRFIGPTTSAPKVTSYRDASNNRNVNVDADDTGGCCFTCGSVQNTFNPSTYDCNSNQGFCQDCGWVCPCSGSSTIDRVRFQGTTSVAPSLASWTSGSDTYTVVTAPSGYCFNCGSIQSTLNATTLNCDASDGTCVNCVMTTSCS